MFCYVYVVIVNCCIALIQLAVSKCSKNYIYIFEVFLSQKDKNSRFGSKSLRGSKI